MRLECLFCVLLLKVVEGQVLYDAFYGKPVTEDRNNSLALLNATSQCTIAVKPCLKEEGRRVDGTCVNFKYPSRNGSPTPFLRMLPASYGMGNSFRPAMNGSELPSARLIRTKILSEGYHEDHDFTVLVTNFFVQATGDCVDILYIGRYSVVSECCVGNTPNLASPACISVPVPADDPFLRRSGVRCMNLTRFTNYQDINCIPNTLPAERLSIQTPLQDLSVIYGYNEVTGRSIRTFQNGLLKTEQSGGVERPPPTATTCLKNQIPRENACYAFGDPFGGNSLQGAIMTSLIFYREHNRIARKLAEINPCWDDEQLFQTAREINIAQWQHMLYYEMMALLLGKKNLLELGVLYDTHNYVNDFDKNYKPGVFHEYALGTRYFHTFQEGRTDLYSNKGKYLGTRTAVDDTLRSGIMELNNTEADLTQGSFRQPTAKIDKNLDPDMAERLLGELQRASDVASFDIQRGRDHGVPPYNAYRKICGLKVAHKWEDFKEIRFDKVEQLRRLYGDVDEVELMPAIYAEKPMEGAFVGPTLFCIMTHNLLQWRKSDRHFYEHGDIPSALTLPQLNEIRKTSFARLMCDSGVGVTKIQPQALLNIGKHNKLTPCKDITGADLTKWKDPKCHSHHDDYHHDHEVDHKLDHSYDTNHGYNSDHGNVGKKDWHHPQDEWEWNSHVH